jgi:hypothetical protein
MSNEKLEATISLQIVESTRRSILFKGELADVYLAWVTGSGKPQWVLCVDYDVNNAGDDEKDYYFQPLGLLNKESVELAIERFEIDYQELEKTLSKMKVIRVQLRVWVWVMAIFLNLGMTSLLNLVHVPKSFLRDVGTGFTIGMLAVATEEYLNRREERTKNENKKS